MIRFSRVWLLLFVILIRVCCVVFFNGSGVLSLVLVWVISWFSLLCDKCFRIIICDWLSSVELSLKDGFLVVVFISKMVLFFIWGKNLFCCVLLKWWILLMNKSVLWLFWCWIFVVLNILCRLGIFVKIVLIWIKCRLVLWVSNCVIVVFLMLGGF